VSIVVCGEALIDLVDEGGGQFRAHPGGSPANVAVGLARLGIQATLLARVSGDAFGRLLRAHLDRGGVDLSQVVAATEPTTLAVVSLDERGVATYDFYVEGTADWQWQASEIPDPLPAGAVALHTGSLALAVPPGAATITDLMRREHERGQVTVSLDPNIRPTFETDRAAAVRRVEEQVSLSDVVKVSEEDLGWLYPGEDPAEIARRWRDTGPAVVVATLGAEGALAVGPKGNAVGRPAVPVRLVDTVGAGDAFTAGLLAGLSRAGLLGGANKAALAALDDAGLTELLDDAVLVAALTCARRGADPPTWLEVGQARSASSVGQSS
jgi:fructokinase